MTREEREISNAHMRDRLAAAEKVGDISVTIGTQHLRAMLETIDALVNRPIHYGERGPEGLDPRTIR